MIIINSKYRNNSNIFDFLIYLASNNKIEVFKDFINSYKASFDDLSKSINKMLKTFTNETNRDISEEIKDTKNKFVNLMDELLLLANKIDNKDKKDNNNNKNNIDYVILQLKALKFLIYESNKKYMNINIPIDSKINIGHEINNQNIDTKAVKTINEINNEIFINNENRKLINERIKSKNIHRGRIIKENNSHINKLNNSPFT